MQVFNNYLEGQKLKTNGKVMIPIERFLSNVTLQPKLNDLETQAELDTARQYLNTLYNKNGCNQLFVELILNSLKKYRPTKKDLEKAERKARKKGLKANKRLTLREIVIK